MSAPEILDFVPRSPSYVSPVSSLGGRETTGERELYFFESGRESRGEESRYFGRAGGLESIPWGIAVLLVAYSHLCCCPAVEVNLGDILSFSIFLFLSF